VGTKFPTTKILEKSDVSCEYVITVLENNFHIRLLNVVLCQIKSSLFIKHASSYRFFLRGTIMAYLQ